MVKSIRNLLPILLLGACAPIDDANEGVDPVDECVFCDDKADAFGISRNSYLAYGIVHLANNASLSVLDDDVPLDARAAQGIVNQRPFEFIEEVDTVPYVGKVAFNNMASYVQDNGLVPFCGDGQVQNLLEACDDGNQADGDGCSSTCEVESGSTNTFFAEQPELIKGDAIGVALVDANGFYFRTRTLESLRVDGELLELLERADGIIANREEDESIDWDELKILSQEPFYSSLFADEKAALAQAWELLRINTAPTAVVEYYGDVHTTYPYDVKIERPGPVEVYTVVDISSADSNAAVRRLQQLPGLNRDGDPNTVELYDLEKGIEDFYQVFTQSELDSFERSIQRMFDTALPSSGGEFVIEYDFLPEPSTQREIVTEFDGWEFSFTASRELHYDAIDGGSGYYDTSFDGNLQVKASLKTMLKYNGKSAWFCGGWNMCSSRPFRFEGVRWQRLNGTQTYPNERGLMLMEYWKDGERIYNRLVEFKQSFMEWERTSYMNEYMGARPQLKTGQPLSFRKIGTHRYNGDYYNRYRLNEVSTVFHRNLTRFFPESADMIRTRLPMGRYQEFEGVSLDIHSSGNAIAYFDGCTLPFKFQDGHLETDKCNNGRKAKIYFSNGGAELLVMGSNTKRIHITTPYSQYETLELDRSDYVIRNTLAP
ncbi:DUF4215 domain-containing protein [Microvenator marinus]|uniref:DUF4215 domain-containing protein n=1 Tax=Microvenator marinus TaxID=2600177 RepID=A0A5B8XPA7_9DELT|nr:myxococcus cysteine-rich repeat containing protein [Microvenator marinus]QED26778.1 DUF4215 domain-containing protein [Microvenator marinus]